MSIINSIRFLFMSQNARVDYIKRQVENSSSNLNIANNDGDFQYRDDGFALYGVGSGRFYEWNLIKEITAYKADLITIDEVRLKISFEDVVLNISEDIPGWDLFIDRLIKALPGIDLNWEDKVIETPFAENRTIIYKR